jgi:alkylation response protein AidB-like acyl-CoA dehydrogenase
VVDLELTDDQRLMVDTFGAFFAKESSVDAVRAADGTGGHDAGLWARFCALGGPLLSLPEPAGGGGGSLLDAALVGLEAGRRLAPLGYADAVVAARALGRATGGAWDDLGVEDAPWSWAPAWAGTVTAVEGEGRGGGGAVSGHLRWTRTGAATRWLVADTGSELVLVDLDGAGVTRTALPNLARFPMAEIRLQATVPAGRWPLSGEARWTAIAEARVLSAAELVGAGRQALSLARDHVLERHQFDRPIGSFQAIQHRLADRHTALDAAELLVLRAASSAGNGEDLRFFSAVALLRAMEAGELAAKEALQFFGGYGFTLEYDIHLYLRYAKALAVLARDPGVVVDALPAALHGSARRNDGGR